MVRYTPWYDPEKAKVICSWMRAEPSARHRRQAENQQQQKRQHFAARNNPGSRLKDIHA
jgi:hypothetical protein